MKTKLILALTIGVLFTLSALAIRSNMDTNTQSSANEPVKICPHSGLPCTGDGECGHEHGQEDSCCNNH